MITSLSSKRWLGRTEFRTVRFKASPGWKAQTIYQSEMALLSNACGRVLRSCLTPPALSEMGILRQQCVDALHVDLPLTHT